jgi:hypothetical protein
MGRKATPSDDANVNTLREMYSLRYKRERYVVCGKNTVNRANKLGYDPSKATQEFYKLEKNAEGKWFIPDARKDELRALSLADYQSAIDNKLNA